MRVAFLTHEPFYPPSGGGSAEATYLVREMVRRGHEVHVFCPRLEERAAVEERFQVVVHEFRAWAMGRYARARNLKYLAYPAFLARMVSRAHEGRKFDLVFTQHSISAAAAVGLKRKLGVKVVMNFLDYLTAFMETWPPYLAPPLLLGRLKRYELSLPLRADADAVLTVSDPLAELFLKRGVPGERLRLIYYGFDSELFSYRENGSMPVEPLLVMHGSLDHHHLRSIAVEALALVSRECPNARLRIVGQRTGALESFLGRLRESAPALQVECTGFLPYEKVAEALRPGAIGIVPYEASSGTHCAFVAKVVEYLALGMPVVCTRLRGVEGYFRNEPMIRFADFDGTDFGRQVLYWLREEKTDLREKARAASERVRRELDWSVIASRAMDFVEAQV